MRECMYCGKQLEKDEVCSCSMSEAKRREREAEKTEPQAESSSEKKDTCSEKKKKRAKRRSFSQTADQGSENAVAGAWRLVRDFISSPIETVMNPAGMGKAEIFILVIAEGIIAGLCAFSIITGASRGPFSFLGNVLGFKGISGYNVLLGWSLSALSGATMGTIGYFIYSGIFYLINKWIFRQYIPYWDFVKRFAFVAIPVSVVGIAGIILGMFSQRTFAILLLCGAVGTIVLTYELLRSLWYAKSASKTMLTMMAGMFIFLLIITHIVRLSM